MLPLTLSLVIPAYLEEENLRILLPRLKAVLSSLAIQSEIIVVDTMISMDNTRSVCEAFGARYVNRRGGNNYGDAVRTGIDEAAGRHIMFMDGDGSHTPEFVQELVQYMDDHDVVVASRYVSGGSTDNPQSLIIMSRIINIMYSVVLGLNCKDVSNSFKVYRAAPLKAMRLTCQNFDIIEEILYKLKRQNRQLRIKEVPFTFKKRMFGNTKRNLLLFMFTYALTLIKLRFKG